MGVFATCPGTIAIGNRSESALTGTLTVGPLPVGVLMATARDFALELGFGSGDGQCASPPSLRLAGDGFRNVKPGDGE